MIQPLSQIVRPPAREEQQVGPAWDADNSVLWLIGVFLFCLFLPGVVWLLAVSL